ncbi:MAG: methyltransferase domain-containing protein [Longimicrobiales bacterium]
MSEVRFDESYGSNPAENYERFFTPSIGEPLARTLLEHAAVQPDERVLDVACGTGVLSRLLAPDIGPDGGLAGLDPNPGMLEVARNAAPASTRIEWYEAAAEEMPLPAGSFDVVLCQMGLQFMPDRSAALREMRRVLDRNGRLLLSVPGPLPDIFDDMATALGRFVGPPAAGFVRQVFSLHDLAELEGILRDAGFVQVEVHAEQHDLELPPPRQFLWQYVHSTPISASASQMDASARAEFERDVLDAWADSGGDGGLELRLRMVVASATKAAA